jgi:NAD dependent epimerase/dehydratase family
MRILITGGTGSLAEYVVKALERDHELVLFDRVKPGEGRIRFAAEHPFVHGDLTNGDDCARAVRGCDAVVHLGAIPYPTDHQSTHTANLQAMGVMPRGLPFDETMRVNTMGTFCTPPLRRGLGLSSLSRAMPSSVTSTSTRSATTHSPSNTCPSTRRTPSIPREATPCPRASRSSFWRCTRGLTASAPTRCGRPESSGRSSR